MPAKVETETNEFKATGFTKGLSWKKVKFRGTLYHLTELPIGDYDEIAKKATKTITRMDGTDYEELDNQLQSRLMLKRCLVSPSSINITELGTKLTIALNRVVNELHYGEEQDELLSTDKAAATEDAEVTDDEGKAPNA